MVRVTAEDIQECVRQIGPATKEEVAAHLGAGNFMNIAMPFRDAAHRGLIQNHMPDKARGISSWIVGTG